MIIHHWILCILQWSLSFYTDSWTSRKISTTDSSTFADTSMLCGWECYWKMSDIHSSSSSPHPHPHPSVWQRAAAALSLFSCIGNTYFIFLSSKKKKKKNKHFQWDVMELRVVAITDSCVKKKKETKRRCTRKQESFGIILHDELYK